MLNCHDATRLMSNAQERELKLGQRLSLNMHTAMCSGCRNFRRQMNALRFVSHAYAKKPDQASSGDADAPL